MTVWARCRLHPVGIEPHHAGRDRIAGPGTHCPHGGGIGERASGARSRTGRFPGWLRTVRGQALPPSCRCLPLVPTEFAPRAAQRAADSAPRRPSYPQALRPDRLRGRTRWAAGLHASRTRPRCLGPRGGSGRNPAILVRRSEPIARTAACTAPASPAKGTRCGHPDRHGSPTRPEPQPGSTRRGESGRC